MKKLNLLFIVILGVTFISCSSDDRDENRNNNNLIGTWYGVSTNGNISRVPDNNIVKFTSDNRVQFIYEGFGIDGEDISEFGNWNKSELTLTITWDESDSGLENYVLEILELNESTLRWKTEITGEGVLTETYTKD
ncbi:hypothetical protein LB456_12105 [Psychroflexus sp. CAK57W]|uniref:hypothetical protein n=1 Tax=Psychroflexus curvus TaxID=2873595 RepID=UPI001CCF42E5|nr:hypothetical protein [Psychroflexus curvus]MBZ9788203.1 hypothetical protein [Psychroflexus curvus]